MVINSSNLYVITFFLPGEKHLDIGSQVFTTKREALQRLKEEQRAFATQNCKYPDDAFRIMKLSEAILLDRQILEIIIKKELN